MRIVITGGTGLIGKRLAASLLPDGHEVIILSRNPQRARDIPAGARLEAWDGQTAAGWGELADGAGALVNLSGEPLGGAGFLPPRWTPALKQRILDSRRNGAVACLEAIKQAGKKPLVLIQSSAIGYYGVHEDEILTEKSGPGDDFAAQVCVAWEASSAAVDETGVRRVVLRSGLVLDRQEGVFTRLSLPFRLFAGGPLGSGNQWMSWIHIDDEIAAIRRLIQEKSASGAFNLTAPNPVQNRDFARSLGKVMHRPAFMPAPAVAFRLAFGEVATLVVDGQRVVPEKLQQTGFKFKFDTLEAALTDLV
jgi:uncharacterized protein (TIGR01777 family)